MGKYVMSEFYCTQCGNKGIDIWRRKGAEREAGHLKKIFCLTCNKETNHAECKSYTKYDYQDFKTEFEYGNFDTNGKRIYTYGELRSLINDGRIEKQKTLDNGRDSGVWEEYMDSES